MSDPLSIPDDGKLIPANDAKLLYLDRAAPSFEPSAVAVSYTHLRAHET